MAGMRKPVRAVMVALGVAGLALAAAGCTFPGTPAAEPTVAPTPTAAATPVPAPAGACQDAFSAAIEWDTVPGVPQVAYVVLTNDGSAACSLTGFPSEVRYVDASGSRLTLGYDGVGPVDAFDRSATPVIVEPGAHAYVWTWILQNAERDGTNPCKFPATAPGLGLTLPGATRPVVAAAGVDVCLDGLADNVQYGPVDSEPRSASKGY
jgi:uncharacterized protein DUF4232